MDFTNNGNVWRVRLNSSEADSVPAVMAVAGAVAAIPPIGPAIFIAIGAAAAYVVAMNKLGGNNGVDVHGIVGAQGAIVTPRFSGMYEHLVSAAAAGVAAATVGEVFVAAAAINGGLANALGLATVGKVFSLLRAGTPLGIALGVALAILPWPFSGPEPDPDQHGGVHADRDQIGEWESFFRTELGNGEISLLSWQGHFSARGGGGGPVFANRPEVKEWERWKVIENGDGSVSLKTFNNHFLVAEDGGGRECRANRTAIGPWEKFRIENLSNKEKIALRTVTKAKYVSVQRDL
jgi:hypothetical protein